MRYMGNDHHPFGMLLVGRKFDINYRYGFNGKEHDTDPYGQGNVYDYGFRIYNPRLGKFLSVDPLTKSFPFFSCYQFASNQPIWAIDLDGLESSIRTFVQCINQGKIEFKVENTVLLGEKNKGPLGNGHLDLYNLGNGLYKYEYYGINGSGKNADTYYYSGEYTVQNTIFGFSISDWFALCSTINHQKDKNYKKEGKSNIEPVISPEEWITQLPDKSACYKTCVQILKNIGISDPARKSLAIQTVSENDEHNGLTVLSSAYLGVAKIDESLENGEPIIVGVNHTYDYGYNENTTDHFIIIVGRGQENGKTFYYFYDVATSDKEKGTSRENKLYLNEDGTLSGSTKYSKTRKYTVSQVRPNN